MDLERRKEKFMTFLPQIMELIVIRFLMIFLREFLKIILIGIQLIENLSEGK